jgi:spore photoproduct lyase
MYKAESLLARPKHFSRIFIEDGAASYPLARLLLERYPQAVKVPIRHYKDILNRSNQNWDEQKASKSIILAVRKEKFLYKGSNFVQNPQYEHFYYNTLMLNCIYDCEYCYLQGMFPGAEIVIFVNQQSFKDAVIDELSRVLHLYLCISYDTDLLAFEGIVPLASEWIRFAGSHENLTIELRTKSANRGFLKELVPTQNVILAWTLSPETIAKSFEKNTPSVSARMKAVQEALALGWKVRICIDPMIDEKDFDKLYEDFILEIQNNIDFQSLYDIHIGTFRMNVQYLKQMRSLQRKNALAFYPYQVKNGVASYPQERVQAMNQTVATMLKKYLNEPKIAVWE